MLLGNSHYFDQNRKTFSLFFISFFRLLIKTILVYYEMNFLGIITPHFYNLFDNENNIKLLLVIHFIIFLSSTKRKLMLQCISYQAQSTKNITMEESNRRIYSLYYRRKIKKKNIGLQILDIVLNKIYLILQFLSFAI